MHLKELKAKNPAELLIYAESLDIENASTLRKQDMMFACLKSLADNDIGIYGDGVLEVLSDGFGFLRSPQSNYLAGKDYSIVDMATFPWIARHEWHDIGLKKFSNLTRWYEQISNKKAVQKGYDLFKNGDKIPKA